MPFPNDRTYSPDINLFLSDGAAYTASGYSTVGGAQAVLDLGGNQNVSPAQQARIDAMLVVDATAMTVTGTNTARLVIALSNDPAFGAGNVVQGPSQVIGAGGSLDVPNGTTSVTGRYEIGFTNQIAGTIYEYMALYIVIGSTAAITLEAFVVVLPEP